MDVNLRVNPEDLQAKAMQVQSEIEQVEKLWNQVQEIVNGSTSYWQGDGSQAHQKLLRDYSAEAVAVLRRLREQPISLQRMAGVYRETEAAAVASSSSLPANVIR